MLFFKMARNSGIVIALAGLTALVENPAWSQVAPQSAGSPAQVQPAANAAEAKALAEAQAKAAAEAQAKAAANGQAKPAENQPVANTPPADKKEEAKPATVQRPKEPQAPPDPRELEIRPDADGKVSFNFSGQPWPAVLEWVASISSLSLDWQELPSDYLNLRTQHKYTVPEAQNLINRHLLMRGFTLVKSGEMLTVVKADKLNPALLPRVEPRELAERQDYEFVKVSFPLEWMLADQAVDELKPLLSPNGKLTALKGANRVEAIDAVINLRELHKVLGLAQSQDRVQETMVREFRLQHRRAADVLGMVQEMLGMERKGPSPGGAPSDAVGRQLMQQMQQMQQMIQQQAQQRNQNPGGGAGGAEKPPEPKLVLNEVSNSILVTATPDKMEIIIRVIDAVDLPSDDGTALLANINRIKGYRLSAIDPNALVTLLRDMGNLSPQSRLQVDEKTKTLIVSGTLADHYTVQSLVGRLDGSTRSFEVIQLRRVQADAVAGTIQYLLGAEEDKSSQSSRYVYYYSTPNNNQKDTEKPFKVDADIDRNRLLLWANPTEMEQIRDLLVKMGETAPGASNPQTQRTFEVDSPEQAEELLRKLRELWPEMAPNELQIQPARERNPGEAPGTAADQVSPPQPPERDVSVALPEVLPVSNVLPVSSVLPVNKIAMQSPDELRRLLRGEGDQEPGSEGAIPRRAAAPPITIQRGINGKLIIGSPDTRALDQLEDLMVEMAPAPKDYKVFQMKYPTTWAYGIQLLLEDFFGVVEDGDPTLDWYGNIINQNSNQGSRMSRRKKLKILSDLDSNTILVQGATPEQLKDIEDLIKVYDRPLSSDPQQQRTNKIFKLQYSQAEAVAETIKQVYRDLLSMNDPALQSKDKEQQRPSTEPSFSLNYSYGNNRSGAGEDDKPVVPQQVKFKGLLSVGVDPVSNTVVISAADALMTDIELLIKTLDDFAKPDNRVQVMPLQNINSAALKARLEKTFKAPAAGENPQQAEDKGQPNGENRGPGNNPNGRGGGNGNSPSRNNSGNGTGGGNSG